MNYRRVLLSAVVVAVMALLIPVQTPMRALALQPQQGQTLTSLQ